MNKEDKFAFAQRFVEELVEKNSSFLRNKHLFFEKSLNFQTMEKALLFGEEILNAPINMISHGDKNIIWERHIIDSLAGAIFVKKGSNIIDIGTGSGFPGIIFGTLDKGIVTLMDSIGKKIDMLEKITGKIGINNLKFVQGRAEELAHGKMREKFDLVTARALAPLDISAELCLPFLKVGGIFLAWKGKNSIDESKMADSIIKKLSGRYIGNISYFLPNDLIIRHILIIIKEKSCSDHFPRKWSSIKKITF